jgi:succinate dehydrogenase/fumarate reductase-like Fe-S protein
MGEFCETEKYKDEVQEIYFFPTLRKLFVVQTDFFRAQKKVNLVLRSKEKNQTLFVQKKSFREKNNSSSCLLSACNNSFLLARGTAFA